MWPSRLLVRICRIALTAAFAVPLFLPLPADAADSDPRAIALAERTLAAMGGQEAWDATRFLRFNFFGFRLHHWDRYTGRHRLEGKSQEGDAYVVLHNVNSRQGEVYLNGERAQGDVQAQWLERAYEAWINDTYWLIMPYKLRDPGVLLSYEGEETIDGQDYDKVGLRFESVGLTPGDHYTAYLNRDTGLMDRWAYILEGWEAGKPATHWLWRDWQTYGRIRLASKRINPDPENGRETELGDLAVFDALPDSVFTSPAPVAP